MIDIEQHIDLTIKFGKNGYFHTYNNLPGAYSVEKLLIDLEQDFSINQSDFVLFNDSGTLLERDMTLDHIIKDVE